MIERLSAIDHVTARARGRCPHCGTERDFPASSFGRVASCGCLRRTNHRGGKHKVVVPAVRITVGSRRPADLELIGRLHLGWSGAPCTLPALAAMLGTDVEDLDLRGGILRPWVEALLVDGEVLVYGRHVCSIARVRDAVEALRARGSLEADATSEAA